jgi:RHS repeat-associated protein
MSWRGGSGTGRTQLTARLRLALAVLVAMIGVFAMTAFAGGTQPYDTYESTVAADGPVAQYRFDDAAGASTLADSAGTDTASNSGITLGGTGPFPGSKSGSFGGSAFASLPSNPLAGATAFSAEGWAYWMGGASYKQPIFDFGSSSTNYMYLTPASALTGHTLLFEIRTTAGTIGQVTAPRPMAKDWEYVTVTETSSGTLTLYLNGVQVGQTTGVTITPSSLGSTPNDWLGKSQVSSDPKFNGSLSNVAFYTKALSASQVAAHFDAAEFPVNSSLPTVSGTAKDGQTLTATAGTWTGLTPITFTYQWTLCESSGAGCANIAAATKTTYKATPEDVGRALRIAVTASNSAGSSSASSNQTATVAPLQPANTKLPAVSGTAKDGQVLTVSTGTWTGTPPLSYAYQWESCNSSGASCSSITGATASTYRVITSQIGGTLRAVVTASNAGGSVGATSAVSAVIAAGLPVNTALPEVSGTVMEGQTLSASTGTWAGTAPFTYTYQWEKCNSSGASCANLTGATSATYVLGSSNLGTTLKVIVTAKNASGSAKATSAATAVVVAKAPANTALPVISGTAQDGQSMSASSGSWTGVTPLSYTYQWQRCNSGGGSCVNISGATSSSYVLGHSDVGTTLSVTVTAKNTAGSASASSATTAVITALAPSNTAVPAITGTARDGQTLTASTGSWAGTPPISYAYQWQSCNSAGEACSNISGVTSSTYILGHGDVGTTLRVMVTASNTAGSASAGSAASAVVVALAPANTTAPTITGTSIDGQTLTASTGTWSGTPTISYSYQWQNCNTSGEACANISGATSSTYTLGHGDVGTTLRVTVTATNAGGSASSSSEATSVVAALAPSNTTAPGISGEAKDSQTLTASTGTWTGTPALTYTYQWQSCNSLGEGCLDISGATGSTYAMGHSDVGTTLSVTVTAKNTAGSASASSAATAVVTALAPSNTAAPAISGEAKKGQTLTASTGSWSGTPSISYAYQWEACNSSGASCANISGATSSSYALGQGNVGTTLRVTVTATNAGGSASSTSEATEAVAAAARVLPSGCVVNGTPEACIASARAAGFADNEISVDEYGNFFWGSGGVYASGTDDESDVYENGAEVEQGHIFRVNVYEGSIQVFVGLNNGTLNEVVAPSDQANTCDYTNEACYGDATHYYGNPGPPAAPVNTTPPAISGGARAGARLSASTGTWTGSPAPSYAYQWQSCDSLGEGCLDISGATASSYTIGSGEVGDRLRVVVSATNSAGSASSTSDATAVVTSSSSCSDTWTGEAGGNSWQTAENWSTGSVPTSSDRVCIASGATVNITSGANAVGSIVGEGGLAISGGSLELAEASTTSTVTSLTLSNATLTGAGSLDVSNAFSLQGNGAMTGSGSLVIGSGAKGVIDASSGCEPMTLSGRTLVNEGSLDYVWGTLEFSEGAKLENVGTLEYNTRSSCYEPQIRLASESATAQILNTGTFERTGEGTGGIGVPFTNDGVVEAQHGRLAFSGGGVPEEVANGSWTVASGGSIALTGGTFRISESVDLSAVRDEGATIELVGGSGPPVSVAAPVISGETSVGHTLTASTGRWEGKGPLTYTYQWQRCNAAGEGCSEISGATSSRYTLAPADTGNTLRVTVTASNSEGQASATSQLTNPTAFPPTNTSAPTISGTMQAGQTLTASTGSWEGASPISYAYQWQRCSEGGGFNDSVLSPAFAAPLAAGGGGGRSCTDIEGATAATYTLQNADVEATVRVVVTAKNVYGETTANSAESEAVIPATAPESTGLPSIYGAAQEGQTLEASEGSWQSPGKITYAYQWQRCNATGEACANIEGAIQAAYVPGTTDLANTLRVTVTASNRAGSTSATSEPTEAVTQAPPPVSKEAPTISGAPKDGRTLTAGTGSWETPFPLTYTYQWQRCSTEKGETCANVSGATSATYALSSADPPDSYVRVIVTATNIYEASASSTSPARLIPKAVRVTEYSYDANGNLAGHIDGNGHTTSYEYGPANEATKATEPDGTATETGYDADGQVTSQTDGNKHSTKYTRNVLGQVTEVTDPLGHKTTKEYDPAGNLTSVTDAAGRTTSYGYDTANRLTEVNYSDGKTPNVKYEYDADGHRTKMTDGTGTTTYGYDQLDRLTETTNGHGDTVGYEYDLVGEQTKVTYPGGKAVERGYDQDGRLASVKDWLGNLTSFAYNPDSNLTMITFPETSGNIDHYAYDNASEMSEASFAKGPETLASLSDARDSEGQVAQTTSKGLPGEETTEYAYDQNNRLTKDSSTGYEYDAAGNPTKTGPSTNAYDQADQLEHSGGTSYTYNEVGERTKTTPASGPSSSYGYDQAGSLTSVSRPEEGSTPKIEDGYTYNGDGLRASQTTSGTTNYLSWDVSPSVPLLLADGVNAYIYGPEGLPIEQIGNSTGAVQYLHHDQQGSTRLLTGASGNVEGAYTYDAYGNQTGHTGAATTPLGYGSQYTSADAGLIYLRARTYDPVTAQFLTADPLHAITGEPYSYTADDPLNYEDPTGLSALGTLEHDAEWLGYQGTRVVATIPYAAYYLAYRTLSTVGSIPVIGKPLTFTPWFIGLYPTEYLGLKADEALDNFKRKVFCAQESEADEGRPIPVDPFHVLPYVYGPGLHENGREDLYPEHNYPLQEGFDPSRNPEQR